MLAKTVRRMKTWNFVCTLLAATIYLTKVHSFVHTPWKNFYRLTMSLRESTQSIERSPSLSQPKICVEERTKACLDFEVIMEYLEDSCVTLLGRQICREKYSNSSTAATTQYAMVDELSIHLGLLPLRLSCNIFPVLRCIELNTGTPEREDLAEFTQYLEQVIEIREYVEQNVQSLSLYVELASSMILPTELVDKMIGAFDEDGNIDGVKYPVVGRLRKEADLLRGQILQTIQRILRSPDMKDKIADSGFTEMEGRYCLMLKNTYKRGVGIVHGSSNSGRTLYVEPMEIVESTNEMKSLQAKLREEENKIVYEMVRCIAQHRAAIKKAVEAVAEIDVLRSKAKLGAAIQGIIPDVGDEGKLQCSNSKHPILLLRGLQPVGNNIELSSAASALVISGPNAGGKTIILKTAGLFALMARYAIPISASRGARVDLMHVMADIGDMQTVEGDLSTFSGHLVVCREILKKARETLIEAGRNTDAISASSNGNENGNKKIGPADGAASFRSRHSLVLLDEIGTGTDPAQGAALAQAVLEELVLGLDARVIVTTHYQRIKELAATYAVSDQHSCVADESTPSFTVSSSAQRRDNEAAPPTFGRFRIAAMEFVDNRPTYRLRLGSVGESFALEAARRMELPEAVLIRANALLDDESRRIVALQQRLEEETEKARKRQGELKARMDELSMREAAIMESKREVDEQIEKLRDNKVDEYLLDLKAREIELDELMRAVREGAASNSSLSKFEKTKAIDDVKTSVKAVRISTEKEIVETKTENIATPLTAGDPIDEGTTLVVLERGNMFGIRGIVTQRNKGRGKVVLSVGGMEMKIERHLLGKPIRTGLLAMKGDGLKSVLSGSDGNISSKEKRMMKMLQDELVDPDKIIGKAKSLSQSSGSQNVKRNSGNTVDIRGKSLPEAEALTSTYIEKAIEDLDESRHRGSIFFVHHSTGKAADAGFRASYRGWLKRSPFVGRLLLAESLGEDSEAFTVAELDLD